MLWQSRASHPTSSSTNQELPLPTCSIPPVPDPLDREVQDTVYVGSTLGFALASFTNKVKELVKENAEINEVQEAPRRWSGFVVLKEHTNCSSLPSRRPNSRILLVFRRKCIIRNQFYLVIVGSLQGSTDDLIIANVYAPQCQSEKNMLWYNLLGLINTWNGMWILLDDFNDVRSPEERFNSAFCKVGAKKLNEFIS
ncbi:hypothetical protein LXL04_010353 [Taraxacum kok-saghyz]